MKTIQGNVNSIAFSAEHFAAMQELNANQTALIEEQARQIKNLTEMLEYFKRKLFGRKSEKICFNNDQISFSDICDDPALIESTSAIAPPEKKSLQLRNTPKQ